ncbi:hypothetical protein GCM10025760_23620 [Microbacterium yannicii]|uniref:LPXTG cell wall anchor domain-containing protein n=2 Tax=Microbacterium yannicii TaxID=671622 RepID=A0ABP9MAM8_9MICO
MPAVRMKSLKIVAGALVAAALVVAPLVTAGATADGPTAPPTAAVADGVPQLVKWVPKSNGAAYWEDLYSAHMVKCYKVDGPNSSGHGSVSTDGKTVTLNRFDQSWPGDHWELLVIKAGDLWNSVIVHPAAGVAYDSPVNNGGQQAQVSHWIVCKGQTPEDQPRAVTPTLTWTLPSCEGEGELFQTAGVTWLSAPGANGSTIWMATPAPGNVFPQGVPTQWTVPDLSKLTENCGSDEPEQQPRPQTSESSRTTVDCTSATATVRTTTTTAEFVWDETAETWQPGEPSSSEVETDRPLTQAELGTCPLVPGEIQSVCVGDVPYLGYAVSLPEGLVVDSSTPVTITFVNPDGEDYVVANQPLSGKLLWPGASDGNPKMWPGWDLVDGEYVQTDGNFAWTRAGVTVEFEVNPTYATEVEYPQATVLCANPPVGSGDEPAGTPTSTDAEALAVTGGGVSPIIVAAGGTALLAGVAVVAIAAYRRRHARAE